MASFRARRASAIERTDLYQDITDRIIIQLEQGRVPWVQPWDSAAAALDLPVNASTRARYSGINILILWSAMIERGFTTNRFLTFRQALELGGNVRKGERGMTVVYAHRYTPQQERERVREEDRAPGTIPFLKRYTVFSTDQCEGLPEDLSAPVAPVDRSLILPEADALIRATGADIRIVGGEAFYVPSRDYIQIPRPEAFPEPINWHRTAFHELGHWTGHPSRLSRDQSGRFGSPEYGREELCAEMTSAFVCAALGIEPSVRHADYLGSWLAILREDNRAIVRAARPPQRPQTSSSPSHGRKRRRPTGPGRPEVSARAMGGIGARASLPPGRRRPCPIEGKGSRGLRDGPGAGREAPGGPPPET